mmetsp:Transcript_248/g.909  ORF Transcript_248/g.909 Transcript_248/m.909 type:complete len:233 (-) Transcript_248:328-1026(-)
MAQPPPPAPVSLVAAAAWWSATSATASRTGSLTVKARRREWLRRIHSATRLGKVTEDDEEAESFLCVSSAQAWAKSRATASMASKMRRTGRSTVRRRAATRSTRFRVLRGFFVSTTSRARGGTSRGDLRRAPSCRTARAPPPKQQTALSRPEGWPCITTSAANAHALTTSRSDTPRRAQRAAAVATENAADDPRPAPRGRPPLATRIVAPPPSHSSAQRYAAATDAWFFCFP